MFRAPVKSGSIQFGSLAAIAVATVIGVSCNAADSGLAPSASPGAPATPTPDTTSTPDTASGSDTPSGSDSESPTDSASAPAPPVPAPTPVSYTGLPFGPTGLWTANRLNWGPEPFTASQNYITADTVVLQIDAARSKGQRLVLAMAGAAGQAEDYITNGQFDMTKWMQRMDSYRTTAIQDAVAAAVADGTVIGNMLIDEPETKRWGTVLTKAMLDQMATYAKQIFPTLPMGVNHGPPAYKWRTSERYQVVDYVLYQYAHYITTGNVTAWRDKVLDQAKKDGVTPMLSINVLNGGAQDWETWSCTGAGQAGRGTYAPNCRMTPDQIRDWGKALAPYGCYLMLWRYDREYMSDPANQEAFNDIASQVASMPSRSCRRP